MVLMKHVFERLFFKNWPRKLVALLTAIFVWFLVNQTITITRTIPEVPVRVINLPNDKTVVGLLPNGLLNKKLSVTITGNRTTLNDLRPNDLEIIINAEGQKDSWIATIDKKNLATLNGEIDFNKKIKSVSANDLFIQLSKLVIDEILITINKPIGDPPKGYQYLDIWPMHLYQKISGPEDQIRALKEKGLEIDFNLDKITEAELDTLYNLQGKREEISFKVPDSWKKVPIPFKDNTFEPLNDPRAEFLRIDFLKQELIPLGIDLPITIFFPLKYSKTINPQTYSLDTNAIVQKKNGLKSLTIPLYLQDVSRLFLDVVKDNLLLIIVAAPKNVQEDLRWIVEFVDEKSLEDAFVVASLNQEEEKYAGEESLTKFGEQALRYRFRDYLRKFVVFTEDGQPLKMNAQLNAYTITLDQK